LSRRSSYHSKPGLKSVIAKMLSSAETAVSVGGPYIWHVCLQQVLDDSLAESQAEWGAANAEYNANIQRLQQHTEALQQKTDSSLALHKCAEE
jgi:hypothetical protein